MFRFDLNKSFPLAALILFQLLLGPEAFAGGHSKAGQFPGMALEEGQTMADIGRGERISRPAPAALSALVSDNQLVVEVGDWIVMTPVNGPLKAGLVFYHGAESDPRIYARPLRAIAEQGYLVVAITMPRYLAVMAPSMADKVLAEYPEIDTWVVAGHSMGGAMAAKYAFENPEKVSGLLLWDAYPPADVDLNKVPVTVAQIYRTDAEGIAPESFRNARHLIPDNALLTPIPEGEHTYFGDYVLASHRPVPDTPLTIDEQQVQIIQASLEFLEQL
jgi:pimeloyl-ACP methyl ester carboxylesterase